MADEYWHVHDYYENIRNKVKNLDPALGDCYKIKGKLPERMCKVPMKVSSSSCFWMRFHYIGRPQNDILFVCWGV